MRIVKILFVSIIACQLSCSDEPVNEIKDPSELLSTDLNCGVRDLFWLNNEAVLVIDNCGNLKRINVTSKSVQVIANFTDYNHLHQASFFSSQVPNSFFYLTLTNNEGSYEEPHQLYNLNLSTKAVQLVADNLNNPILGSGVTFGNKHLAVRIPGSNTINVIDLASLAKEDIVLSGEILAFSPDDRQALVFLDETETVSLYDFECHCLQPITLNGSGVAIWREEGLFGASVIQVQSSETFPNNLVFEDLATGEDIGAIPNLILGAYVAPQGTLTGSFVASPNYDEDFEASLITFDLLSRVKKTVVTVNFNWLFHSGLIEKIAISSDQKNIVYVFNYSEVRMVEVE